MAEGRRDAIASGWHASNANERVPLTDACDLTIALPGASGVLPVKCKGLAVSS